MQKKILSFFNDKEQKFSFQLIIVILLAFLFRSFIYEPFKIPSGSMKPTLIIGDCVFVSKFSYGFSRYSLPLNLPILPDNRILEFQKPKRGDVVVFRGPKNPYITYIKRVVGLPNDRIQVINGILYINSREVARKEDGSFFDIDDQFSVKQYIETLVDGRYYNVLDRDDNLLDHTELYIVPPDHYFFMGDNRDQSGDSRLNTIGYVHEKYLVGKAQIIFFSARSNFLTLWNLFRDIKINRFFISLDPKSST